MEKGSATRRKGWTGGGGAGWGPIISEIIGGNRGVSPGKAPHPDEGWRLRSTSPRGAGRGIGGGEAASGPQHRRQLDEALHRIVERPGRRPFRLAAGAALERAVDVGGAEAARGGGRQVGRSEE